MSFILPSLIGKTNNCLIEKEKSRKMCLCNSDNDLLYNSRAIFPRGVEHLVDELLHGLSQGTVRREL